ncbi:4Fe-4S binding protein [uncultured Victivallis sp.]|uniref:4Fe-4S binding protein n=1 Tax=uncultured Victivallis sp. TaxID=354118 RepID=UPI0025E2726F|nr:4Fe-4S binding protein [uncultured Victivallis sp.]
MKRKIIEIDTEKCNGCGKCIPNCPEGALQLIDGKARLVSDLFCDGLGACIGECPLGAIRVVEREAEPYDERRVMEGIIRQGEGTIRAHLEHLRSHGEFKLLEIAIDCLKERGIPVPQPAAPAGHGHGGCPGMLAKKLAARPAGKPEGGVSALRQWPVQLKLLNPAAEYFDDADLLVSADCVAHAYGSFHRDLLDGKILIILCPKLDSDIDGYVEKLAEIFRRHKIRSVTVARMEVPCCGGTVEIVRKALEAAGSNLEVTVKTVTIDGEIQ